MLKILGFFFDMNSDVPTFKVRVFTNDLDFELDSLE